MQKTPRANRPHIGIFGRRNSGKSTLVNALTNQQVSVVSSVPGTTTDPVYKSMELHPLGPVVIIDTAGIDDEGSLGELRVQKTKKILRQTDVALLLIDAQVGLTSREKALYEKLARRKIPTIVVINKIDLSSSSEISALSSQVEKISHSPALPVSAEQQNGIERLQNEIVKSTPEKIEPDFIAADLIPEGSLCMLVTPIDEAAPKGRLILPQVQTIRDLLDHHCMVLIIRETELQEALDATSRCPDLVVCDSQVFAQVDAAVPSDVPLSSFSILFARFKGDLDTYLDGLRELTGMKQKMNILIAEACTHRRTHEDVGTVKIPKLLRARFPDREFSFEHCAGGQFPNDLNTYDLVLHCGGCMINRKEMMSRLREAAGSGVPVINYGMLLAYLHGILLRALQPLGRNCELCFEEIAHELL